MIKFSNQVPSVYPNTSRDFQYLCWLIDIVLNSVKHNVDDMYELPNNGADIKLTELLAMTLGFKIKRNYDQKQLYALIAALPRILKYKGAKKAVDMAGEALIAASGVSGRFISEIHNGEFEITFPVGLIDISLFTDLLEYILPAGMTYHIVRKTEWGSGTGRYSNEFDYSEVMKAEWVNDMSFNENTGTITSLSNLMDIPMLVPSFTNFNEDELNIGLLDNSIIPILAKSIGTTYDENSQPKSGSADGGSENNNEGTDVVI